MLNLEASPSHAYANQIVPIVPIVVPFFWFNQICNKDPIRYPQKGTTMETTGNVHNSEC